MTWFYTALTLTLFIAMIAPIVLMEKTRRSFLLAWRSLWLHKLRAFLSVLGIIIGTAAVITLMGFGEGSMQDALDDIKREGATNVIIRSVKPPDEGNSQRRSFIATYGLTMADYDRFLNLGDVVTNHVPMRVFPQEVRHLEHMENGRIVATTPSYAIVHSFSMASGRFLTEEDDHLRRNVAVLGWGISQHLFPFENPLGQTVRFNENRYVVVGIINDRMPTGGSGGSQAAEEFNNDIYIPLRTCYERFGEKIVIRQSGTRGGEKVQLHQVVLTIADIDKVRAAGEFVRDSLRKYHLKKDWAVTVPLDRLNEAERAKKRYQILLAFIAGISLVVGGIGIMNIMLATVTERTREIGIRRALGAKRRDITFQFLVEAVVQTTIGGLCGVALGLGILFGVPPLAAWIADTNLPAQVHVPSIFLSLAVAVSVGILFGWYPARRASHLDPIEALRHV
jgi:putative ABC transport system permease protein